MLVRETPWRTAETGAFKIKSHQGYLYSLKLLLHSASLKKLLIILLPHNPLLINNLIILNLILIGMFVFFLAGYMLPQYHYFGKKTPFFRSEFSVTVCVESSSDFSILTHVSTVLP